MPTSKSSVDHRDVYYRLGKSAGYRARSAYKLLHLDEEFDLFSGVETAVDLCAAPGSWSQVLGQKLKPSKDRDGRKVVSIDLQPMARLPNITILQTDITLPSTIPLVLDALGGRKADLVVCDGAPDVTGVHDLDAYLHSQLLLAAITLSLTLLAPHSTLIFKIFLSPLDPQASLLASQLKCFFPGPMTSEVTYKEFDLSAEEEESMEVEIQEDETRTGNVGKAGYDMRGRRGGVWVRKPRSSRAGSGEAFIVCRNFDSARVPLPQTFTSAALAELRRQTSGTLTLDSLSYLGSNEFNISKEWEMIKGYVGGGDLNPIGSFPTPSKSKNISSTPPINIQLPVPSSEQEHSLSTSPKALFAHPTPLDGPPEYFSPKPSPGPSSPTLKPVVPPVFLSPERIHLDTHRLAGPTARATALAHTLGETLDEDLRQSSLDSLTPNPSPIQLSDPSKPWSSSSHLPPAVHHTHSHSASGKLSVPSSLPRIRSSSNASIFSTTSTRDDEMISNNEPLVSPALSSASKTDLFFASSIKDSLPLPPRALPHATTLGRGLPSSAKKIEDRSTSMPSRQSEKDQRDQRTSAWAEASSNIGSIDLTSPFPSSQGYSGAPTPPRPIADLKFGFEDFTSTSRLRSMSSPAPFPDNLTGHSPATSRFLNTNINESLATLPTLPDVNNYTTPTKKRPTIAGHGRRESQQLEREHREAKEGGTEVNTGDLIGPAAENGNDKRGWTFIRKLGEGAFSSVWSAIPQDLNHEDAEKGKGKVAALKMMDRQHSLLDSRTKISFLREVEVLRHISHPSIVSYLDSFTTPTHHVLVLEQLEGGELFDLMSVDENRRRMILPCPEDQDGEGLVRRIFSELTRGVGWLHEVGVVHRDIKLENILLTMNPFILPPTSTQSIPLNLLPKDSPLIKLTDFGLSRFISTSSPLLQTRCGSESFAAPEIIMGRPYDGRETDAWAMGVVLYGMIIGELPFDREEEITPFESIKTDLVNGNDTNKSKSLFTPNNTDYTNNRLRGRKRMMRIAKGEYSFPSNSKYSLGVKEVIQSLLIRDPKKRFKVGNLWEHTWMSSINPGGVNRPAQPNPTPTRTPISTTPTTEDALPSLSLGLGSNGNASEDNGDGNGNGNARRRRRRVLDGFLVEEDGIEEVARAEL
ncbi:uncharacterized protein IL334_000747 [Kwoniella shivajii]|uniref:Protein kinase domain-containing protein n=1 Tax=Kwoniella shivajii TaxID=564305 RepID=A0ABZ1CU81_9TREE|nr:hypothetical protein IL334_000747 [Kwoniella shivajii]